MYERLAWREDGSALDGLMEWNAGPAVATTWCVILWMGSACVNVGGVLDIRGCSGSGGFDGTRVVIQKVCFVFALAVQWEVYSL